MAGLPAGAHAAVLRNCILSLGAKQALLHLQSADFRRKRGSTARAFRTLQTRSREIKLVMARHALSLSCLRGCNAEWPCHRGGRRKVVLKKVKEAKVNRAKELTLPGFSLRCRHAAA